MFLLLTTALMTVLLKSNKLFCLTNDIYGLLSFFMRIIPGYNSGYVSAKKEKVAEIESLMKPL